MRQPKIPKRLEYDFPGRPAIGMCQYPVELFAPKVLDSVWRNHRQMMVDPEAPSAHRSLMVNPGARVCEIVTNKFVVNPNYYYVVKEQDRHEVMGWGAAANFEMAGLGAEHIARHRTHRCSPN